MYAYSAYMHIDNVCIYVFSINLLLNVMYVLMHSKPHGKVRTHHCVQFCPQCP